MTFRLFPLAIAAFAIQAAVPAFAHPKLLTATPAAGQTVAATRTVTLTFSERLTPRLTTATLMMTGMPGVADHPEMKMAGVTSAVAPDGKSIVVTAAKPLPAGTYRIDWVVIGADAHRITGQHAFSIR